MNVRYRSYSALPAPLNSPQYLQAVRQEIRVLALAAGAIFPVFLVGCSSIFVPISLDSFSERVTVEQTEVLEPPQIAVEPHSDGMGWTVRARQRVREHQRIDVAERWKGKRYEAKGNIGTVVAGALLCPVGALYGTALAIGRPDRPSWDSIEEYCLGIGGLDLPGHQDTETRVGQTIDHREYEAIQGIEDAHARFLWHLPGKDPIGVEIPAKNLNEGVGFRLRWLADTMERNGILLNRATAGYASIEVEGNDAGRGSVKLTITGDRLAAASRQGSIRTVPRTTWPKEIRVRLVMEHDRETPKAIQQQLHARVSKVLAETGLQLVVREGELQKLTNLQQTQLQPQYSDPSPSIGRLTGASVIVMIRPTLVGRDAYQVYEEIVSVETGQILAAGTIEDQAKNADRLIQSTAQVIVDLLQAQAGNRREGWMIRP